jgi:UDP-N-acetylglucosamine--N-acetylmuramyl-(pentapeptide) pyrophosphoryl-undecaprenol N-acetylglucosamine transferase
MKILMAGGGTGGPVAPLIAVAEQLKKENPGTEILFVGTKTGPEQKMLGSLGFDFVAIPAAKLRRYFSLRNFLDIFVLIGGLIQSWKIISQFKPDAVFSAGGYVAVPVAWVAELRGIKTIVHQQDAQIGLANKMVEPFAKEITTVFEETARNFPAKPGRKIEWVGNPVRQEFLNGEIPFREVFKLHDQLPILMIFGGATGARQINSVVDSVLSDLVVSHQVIHIRGAGQPGTNFKHANYHAYEFLTKEMASAMKLAHIVLCRAGLSTIAELSALGKVSIVVPMPDSHQEENAKILKDRGAAVVLFKDEFRPDILLKALSNLRYNKESQTRLSENMKNLMPKDSVERIAKLITSLANGTN